MKLSAKGEYACLALIYLTEQYTDGVLESESSKDEKASSRNNEVVRISDIAEAKHIPAKYLEQILMSLKRAGYVRSRRGPSGGYQLAKPPESITLAEIIRLMDGSLAPTASVSTHFYEKTPISGEPKLLDVCRNIRDYVSDTLEQTKFADLI